MKTEYAYIAGFIDGEGYIGLTRRGKSFRPRVIVSNCNLNLLEEIKEIIGGYISKKKMREGWTQGYNLTSNRVSIWLPLVLPYLRGKKAKAKLLLSAIKMLEKRAKKTNQAGDIFLKELGVIDKQLRLKEWLL